MGRLVVVARGLYLARHLFTLSSHCCASHSCLESCSWSSSLIDHQWWFIIIKVKELEEMDVDKRKKESAPHLDTWRVTPDHFDDHLRNWDDTTWNDRDDKGKWCFTWGSYWGLRDPWTQRGGTLAFPRHTPASSFLFLLLAKKIIPWNVGRKKEEQFSEEKVYNTNFWWFFSPHIAWRCLDGQTLRESWPLSQSLRPCLHLPPPKTNVFEIKYCTANFP